MRTPIENQSKHSHTNTHSRIKDYINRNNNKQTSREMKKIIAQGNSNSSIIYQ